MSAPPIVITVQQQQMSTYNHPCGDLLDGERRRDYLDIVIPMYKATKKGDVEAAEVILQGHEFLVRHSINERKETPLHVAAAGHSIEFVRYLVNKMSKPDLELQNVDGNTAFCIAAISGNVAMVKIMFEKNQALPIICGSENKTPLYLAAFHGNYDMVNFLYGHLSRMSDNWTSDVIDGVLLKCLENNIFGVALKILKDNVELPQNKHAWDMLQVLAQKPEKFFEYKSRIRQVLETYNWVTSKERIATVLLRLLWERIMKRPKNVIDEIIRGPMIEKDDKETYPSQIPFIAAKMNNAKFLAELICEYPDLIWKRNDDGQTIFHISVSHRQVDIFCLLSKNGSMKHLVTTMTDQQGNNILHLAGKKPEKYAYRGLMAAPFQLFREVWWYKKVANILPYTCIEAKNAEGLTPRELFVENHGDLVSKGIKSINETINLSMVVAVLVCTIGFSVVFQIPGGFDQKNGFPMFLDNNYFIVFVVMDIMSFVCATISIFFFLSVILPRDRERMQLLFERWLFGQVALMYSIFFLVATFFLSFSILYRKSKWTYGLLYGFCLPLIISYARMSFSPICDAMQTMMFMPLISKANEPI